MGDLPSGEHPTVHYADVQRHLIRWTGAKSDDLAAASDVEWLHCDGWIPCGPGLRMLLRLMRNFEPIDEAEARRRSVRACCASASAVTKLTVWRRLRCSAVAWAISPPLGSGAPRFLDPKAVRTAETSYAAALGTVSEALTAEARLGLDRTSARLQGIEARSSTFVQAAGLTSTLVLANGALLFGDDRVGGVAEKVVIAAVVVAAVALLVAGLYGMAAVMRTFGHIAPDATVRLERRSRLEETVALRSTAATVMLAQRRASLVGDWKLARLKRAALAFLVTVVGIGVASGSLVYAAATHHDSKAPAKASAKP